MIILYKIEPSTINRVDLISVKFYESDSSFLINKILDLNPEYNFLEMQVGDIIKIEQ